MSEVKVVSCTMCDDEFVLGLSFCGVQFLDDKLFKWQSEPTCARNVS